MKTHPLGIKQKIITLFFVLFTFAVSAKTSTNIVTNIPSDISQLSLSGRIMVHHVMGDTLTFQKAKVLLEEKGTLNEGSLYLGYGSLISETWVSFTLKNNASLHQVFLDIPNSTVPDITVYNLNEGTGELVRMQTGNWFPFDTRFVPTATFTFPIDMQPTAKHTVYLCIRSHGDALNIPINIWNPIKFMDMNDSQLYVNGLYIGILFFISLFYLFLWINLKDTAMLYYTIYVFGMGISVMSFRGVFAMYLAPDMPRFAIHMMPGALLASFAMLVGFFLRFFKQQPKYKYYYLFLKFVQGVGLSVAAICMIFTQWHGVFIFSVEMVNYYMPFCVLLTIVGAFLNLKHQPVLAKYFIGAFLFLIMGNMVILLQTFGLIVGKGIAKYGILIGSAGELIVLAFGLSVRFKMRQEQIQTLALERLENLNSLKDQYNSELENKVEERTFELSKSNKRVNDSIIYAERIQRSLLSNHKLLRNIFKDSFILFKPRDIVSGDFFWGHQADNGMSVFAVVDCTGHGVPGAFMSILGSSLLKEIVEVSGQTDPGKILDQLDLKVRSALKQNEPGGLVRDGMDVALISYDQPNAVIQFAGAKRPLFICRNGNIEAIKSNVNPIGGSLPTRAFVTHALELEVGDGLYMFSDGYVDQFGGPKNKKYMTKRFKSLIKEIGGEPMKYQQTKLSDEIDDWMGEVKQIDDILVVGIRVTQEVLNG